MSYISKLVCFAFAGKKKMSGKEDESTQFASYFCSVCGAKESVTKISRILVHEGICRRSESLFL